MGLSTEDRLDIQDLYARYNHAIDSGDGAAWAATFTTDGTFKSGPIDLSGTDALKEFGGSLTARMSPRHWTNNLTIDEAPGGAKGSCYLMLYNVKEKPAALATTGIYRDELTKTSDGWRFKARTVHPD
jgi:3-phenylpropionate/cinnamic acid dioxygenase small subunit